jgi:hypothetical protein
MVLLCKSKRSDTFTLCSQSRQEGILGSKGRANFIAVIVNKKVTSFVHIKATKFARARGVVA